MTINVIAPEDATSQLDQRSTESTDLPPLPSNVEPNTNPSPGNSIQSVLSASWSEGELSTSLVGSVNIRQGPAALAANLRIDTAIKEKEQVDSPFAQDSLSLVQLKRLVAEVPKLKQAEYSFTYAETDCLEQEIEEWFVYTKAEQDFIGQCKACFEQTYNEVPWIKSSKARRRRFITKSIDGLESSSQATRTKSAQCLNYLVQGVFGETRSKDHQLHWIKENCRAVRECSNIEALWGCIRAGISREWDVTKDPLKDQEIREAEKSETKAAMSVLYFLTETGRDDEKFKTELGDFASKLSMLHRLTKEYLEISRVGSKHGSLPGSSGRKTPLGRCFRSFIDQFLMVSLGTFKQYAATKKLRTSITAISIPPKPSYPPKAANSPFAEISASPLDYHNFRQELLSKYPAYNPPPLPKFAATSLLLPAMNLDTLITQHMQTTLASTTPSILHQPVHIATPAPSPPPSPVGTKGAKKHNYQTNQNFPFLYPPTASGGWNDGWADMNSSEVGVPLSIKEGGDLFRARVRVSSALQQIAEERERFMKLERGWVDSTEEVDQQNELAEKVKNLCLSQQKEEQYLDYAGKLYEECLPYWQSFVIVLLKVILANLAQQSPTSQTNGLSMNGERGREDDFNAPNPLGELTGLPRNDFLSIEELDKIRQREVVSKAVSSMLVLLLKWFRVSHVLKYEYLTQLLLDSNYLPLVLKVFNHQEPTTLIGCINDEEKYSYFFYCNQNSSNPQAIREPPTEQVEGTAQSSDDEAAPPPVVRRRREGTGAPSLSSPTRLTDEAPLIINDFSWRNFATSINFLRVMQKVCKGKAHRNLLMVQYKSSTILKKALKIPQDDLRLYTLKLFKGQVPYCGRKWRQSNMRVITSIYLHCRPELRDDWLAGSDVDAEVEEALPQEQALRALTHFYNLHHYPTAMTNMGFNSDLLAEERDFFARELDRLDRMGVTSDRDGLASDAEGEDAGWDGPPPMEDWSS